MSARVALRVIGGETTRYLTASAIALAADFMVYVSLIRLAGLSYLIAAPCGFAFGLALVYLLSVRWVFRERRLDDARAEFMIFTAIGVGGLALNQGAVYAGVEWVSLPYELAKLVSALIVFGFNFGCRKLLLFTRY